MSSLLIKLFRPVNLPGAALVLIGLSTILHAQAIGASSHSSPQNGMATTAVDTGRTVEARSGSAHSGSTRAEIAHPEVAGAAPQIAEVGGGALSVNQPKGVGIDAAGNLYIANTGANTVVMVSAVNGTITPGSVITTIAGNGSAGYSGDGGAATSAQLWAPSSVAVDASGNVYIADVFNNRIRKVAAIGGTITASSVITTVAGDGTGNYLGDNGPAMDAELFHPQGIALDPVSGDLYIADTFNYVIRKVSAAGAPITGSSTITTYAGIPNFPSYSGDGGPATSATLRRPNGVAVDASGNLYIADPGAPSVRKVIPAGTISTVVGDGRTTTYGVDGPLASATLTPYSVAVDAAGNLYVALGTSGNGNRVTLVSPSAATITTIAGNGLAGFSGIPGIASEAELADPEGVAVDQGGSNLFIASTGLGAFAGAQVDQVAFSSTVAPKLTAALSPSASITTVQALSVTISVTGPAGSPQPNGSVTLAGGGYTSPAATVAAGSATIVVPAGALAVAPTETLSINFTPDSSSSSLYGSTSITQSISVVPGAPTVSVTPSASTILTTDPLTVTIAVIGGSAAPPPTGSVTLTGGNYTSASTTIGSGGTATISIPAGSLLGPPNSYSLTVDYVPDSASSAIYIAATGNAEVTVKSITNLTPTVTVTPSASTVTAAQTLTMPVVVSGPEGKPTPTGSVTLSSSGGTFNAGPTTLVGGSATFTLAPGQLSVGSYLFIAAYAPDNTSSSVYSVAQSAPAAVSVTLPPKVIPTITVTPSAPSITTAQALTVIVAVAGDRSSTTPPTGTLALTSGSYLSTATLTGSAGTTTTATFTIPYGALAPGSDTLAVSYVPSVGSSSAYSAASGAATVMVTALPKSTPSVTVTPNPPSGITTATSIAVTVALSGTPAPTGSVILASGSYTSAASPLSNGSTTITIPVSTLPAGTDALIATYAPDLTGSVVYTTASGSISVAVAPAGTFVVSNGGGTLTLTAGATSSNTSVISATPSGGFTGALNLSCAVTTSLTNYADVISCALGSGGTTASLMINGSSPATTTLTVLSTAASSHSQPLLKPFFDGAGAAMAGLLLLGLPVRRRSWRTILSVVALLVCAAGLGCGGSSNSGGSSSTTKNPGTTPGPYLVTVTGSDAATGTISSVNTLNVIVK